MIMRIHTTILWGLKIMLVSHCSGQITVGVGLAQLTRSCGPTRSCGLAIWSAILHIIHSSHDCADPHNHPVGGLKIMRVSHCSGQITVGAGLAQLTRSCGPTRSCGLPIWLAILHTIVQVSHSSHDHGDPHNHPVGPQDHAGQSHCSGQITVGAGLAQLTRSCGPTRSCGLAIWSAILHIIMQVSHSSHDHADPHTTILWGHKIMRFSHCSGQITVGEGLAQLTRSCGPTRSCGLAIWSAILHIVQVRSCGSAIVQASTVFSPRKNPWFRVEPVLYTNFYSNVTFFGLLLKNSSFLLSTITAKSNAP